MYQLIAFLTDFFVTNTETVVVNKALLITVIVILVVALFICMMITRKNHMYINKTKKVKTLKKFHKKEVV